MLSNTYLYGDHSPAMVPQDVIDDRTQALTLLRDKELSRPYMERDNIRLGAVHRAIYFWENINKADLHE